MKNHLTYLNSSKKKKSSTWKSYIYLTAVWVLYFSNKNLLYFKKIIFNFFGNGYFIKTYFLNNLLNCRKCETFRNQFSKIISLYFSWFFRKQPILEKNSKTWTDFNKRETLQNKFCDIQKMDYKILSDHFHRKIIGQMWFQWFHSYFLRPDF